MPDLILIEKHINYFFQDFENLKKYNNITEEDLKKNIDLLWIIERGLFLCIQNILDMYVHIVSSDFNDVWEYYSDIPDILEREELITQKEKDLFIQIIGLRNRLSHEYISIDKKVLVNIMNNNLNDLVMLVSKVKDYCWD
ncbi:MAG: type VII toxin-antitoxin system HepT family RNase toxin [Stygiobacter sp.]